MVCVTAASNSNLSAVNLPAYAGDEGTMGSVTGLRKISWSRKWQPTPILLPGKSHGQRSLTGCSPWGHRIGRSWAHGDTTEHTHTCLLSVRAHFSLLFSSSLARIINLCKKPLTFRIWMSLEQNEIQIFDQIARFTVLYTSHGQ